MNAALSGPVSPSDDEIVAQHRRDTAEHKMRIQANYRDQWERDVLKNTSIDKIIAEFRRKEGADKTRKTEAAAREAFALTLPVSYKGERFPRAWTEARCDKWFRQRNRERLWLRHSWRAEDELREALKSPEDKARDAAHKANQSADAFWFWLAMIVCVPFGLALLAVAWMIIPPVAPTTLIIILLIMSLGRRR